MVSGLSIRPMTEGDIDFGLSLGKLSGWNQVPADWRRLVRYQPDACFLGTIDEQPVATITATCYKRKLAWIGMMLVHPDFRRKGIASALMRHVLNWLQKQKVECIKLDATPTGATVYERLGFQLEWGFHRYEKPGTVPTQRQPTASPHFLAPSYDVAAFGVERTVWLTRLAADSCVIQEAAGFGMLRPGRLANYLGPVVALSESAAESLIRRLVETSCSRLFWDIPGPNQSARELAEQVGFTEVRPLSRMWLGQRLITGNPEMQFALASLATG